jgi:hypothetical protein
VYVLWQTKLINTICFYARKNYINQFNGRFFMNNRNISNAVKAEVSERIIPIYVGTTQPSCTLFGFPKDIVGVIGGTMVRIMSDEEREAEEKRAAEEKNRSGFLFGKSKHIHF